MKIDELRRLLEQATPGQVQVLKLTEDVVKLVEDWRVVVEMEDDGEARWLAVASCPTRAYARLIAAAVNALPALLAVAEAAQRMRAAREAWHQAADALNASDVDPLGREWTPAIEAELEAEAARLGQAIAQADLDEAAAWDALRAALAALEANDAQ